MSTISCTIFIFHVYLLRSHKWYAYTISCSYTFNVLNIHTNKSYLLLINGMLMQFATATAAKGANLVTIGGIFYKKVVILFIQATAKKLLIGYILCLMNFKILVTFN